MIDLRQGDCQEILPTLEDNSVDSLVCDPPAGISFMGRNWDGDKGGRDNWIAWLGSIMAECLRILKPGGHAFVWALPRTSHWTGMALENAGFEIRDSVHHIQGAGFPKSLDISKAIDAAAGAEREKIGERKQTGNRGQPRASLHYLDMGDGKTIDGRTTENAEKYRARETLDITTPSTPQAKQWNGWGTALKPAHEVWWLVRKPFPGTVASNVQEWGTGE